MTDLNPIPLLASTLGFTYDVPSGKYADPTSCKQQVISWEKFLKEDNSHTQQYGDKTYRVPNAVNFEADSRGDYVSVSGKSASDYSKSLSLNASIEAEFPGFSGSAKSDFSSEQRGSLANNFTRISYNTTHYILSLKYMDQIQSMLDPRFVKGLDDAADAVLTEQKDDAAFTLFDYFGTHLLRSVVVGGRGAFLSSTDSRKYSSEISIEAAAAVSASYGIASGKIELDAKHKQAMNSFNESSDVSVQTQGGDSQYANENFVKNVEAWSKSIIDYPSFMNFGPSPSLVGIWQFCSTPERQQALLKAYGPYSKKYTKDLALPGPYVNARLDDAHAGGVKQADMKLNDGTYARLTLPPDPTDDYYFLSPGFGCSVIGREIVDGALSVVKWKHTFDVDPLPDSEGGMTRVWSAIAPKGYTALGCAAFQSASGEAGLPKDPPAGVVGQYRAVHNSALTAASSLYTWALINGQNIYVVNDHFYLAGSNILKEDCLVLDSKNAIIEWK